MKRSLLPLASLFVAGLFTATATAADIQPLKLVHAPEPMYPLRLQIQGIKDGDAQLLLNVDDQGRLEDYLVIGYSRPEFADAAVTAVKQWRFEPMRRDGEPITTTQEVTFTFKVEGLSVVVQTPHDYVQQQMERMVPDLYRFRCYTLREIDRLPAPHEVVAPSYPQQLADQGVVGRVTVEFFIDQEGRVRMPSILKSAHEELAAAAIVAVRRWRFDPPTRHGQPVLVRAVQEFNFKPTK